MEPKTYLWVGGGLVALIVVYYVIKSRSGGGGVSAGGESFGGGGGIGGSSPVSYAPGAPDTSGDRYQQQLNDLDVQARQEALAEQKAMFGLQQEQAKQQIGLWGAQQTLLLEGAAKEQQYQLGYEQEAYRTAQAAQEVVTRSVKGKSKVECPKGMHLVVGADGTPACQEKGGGGFSLKTVFEGIGNIAEGLFTGAAAAAPGIGYGAANAAASYGLSQAGIPNPSGYNQTQARSTLPGSPSPYYTPPIAGRQPMPSRITGANGSIESPFQTQQSPYQFQQRLIL